MPRMRSLSTRFVASLLAALLVLPALAACNTGQSSGAPASQGENTEPNTPAPTERTITDQAGRTVTLPAEVNRVITTWRPGTLLIMAAGGKSKLVATDGPSQQSEFLVQVFPEITSLPKVGSKKGGLNVEAIVAAKPDVVFVWSGSDVEPVIQQLESQQIPVVVLVPETLEQMEEAVMLAGKVMGTEEQAQQMISYYDEKLNMLSDKLGTIPADERSRVYMVGAYGVYSTASGDLYQNFLIEQAGGVNVASELKGGWAEVSAEQLVQWNPDVIVAVQYCGENCDPASIKSNPQLQTIKAVQNDKVYMFPSAMDPWDYPEPRSILGMLWLAKILYPDKMADLDLIQEVDNFHKTFFGKTFTELGGTLDE